MEGCKLYPLFLLRASLKTWQLRYCESNWSACERYQMARRGESVPLELLPNGKRLPTRLKDE
jgi:hypothetical protein